MASVPDTATVRLGLTPNLRRITVGAGLRALGLSLIGPFLALYLHDVLLVGYVEIGLIVAAIGVPPLFIGGVGGLLADRVGRRRLFLVAFAVEGSSIFAAGFAMAAHSFPGVLAAFAASGVAGNLGGPAIAAYVSDFTSGSMRTRAFTWQRVGWNVGFALGVSTGGLLLVVLGFAPVAWGAGAATLVGTAYLTATLEPSPYDIGLRAARPPDAAPSSRPGSVRDSLRVLRHDRAFLLFCIAAALAYVTLNQWSVTFSLFVVGPLGLPYSLLGLGFATNGLVVVFGQVPTTQMAIGRQHTALAVAGVGAYMIAFLALGVAALLAVGAIAVFFAAVIVLTLGENLTSIPFSTLPSNVAPRSEVGAYNGAFSTIAGIGSLLAIVVGGVALATIHNPVELWAVLCAPGLPAIGLLLSAGRRLPRRSNRA
ncbi:MAG: MFS transporter [Thermoplasmata archaeon]|nr:MFS transporter [Thermoplasmata archaeon]MCI4362345.1 MFS transporter [Thermoplasmata archaeon]